MIRRNNNDKESPAGGNGYILPGILTAIIAGSLLGGFLPETGVQFSLLGRIFLNLLMMIVVPLVIFSIITGITNLGDVKKLGGMGTRTIVYYMITTSISVIIGIILVSILKPGTGFIHGEASPSARYQIDENNNRVVLIDGPGLVRWNYDERYELLLSDQQISGAVVSATRHSVTVRTWERHDPGSSERVGRGDETRMNTKITPRSRGRGFVIDLALSKSLIAKKDRDILDTLEEVVVGDEKTGREGMIPRNIFNAMSRMDVLGLIFFSIVFGVALSVIGERGSAAVAVAGSINHAVHKIVDWIMLIAPLGIFGIIAGRVGQAGGFAGFLPELAVMGKYVIAVVAGLCIHAVVVLPLILFIVTKKNPLRFIAGVGAALLNAFSTASSSATLPITMETVEKNNGISQKTAGFVLPIGATINMDGTALYEAVAAIFIAQVYGIDLTMVDQTVIFITATLAAVGAAGIPEAGLVTMVIVLRAVGLPVEGIGLILAIDWFLDRCRTTVNVWGDSVGAGVIDAVENFLDKRNNS